MHSLNIITNKHAKEYRVLVRHCPVANTTMCLPEANLVIVAGCRQEDRIRTSARINIPTGLSLPCIHLAKITSLYA
jgi:hypothetical protein